MVGETVLRIGVETCAMGKVDDAGLAGMQSVDDLDRFLDGLMRGVELVTQTVDNQHVESTELVIVGVRHGLHVRDIGECADAVA